MRLTQIQSPLTPTIKLPDSIAAALLASRSTLIDRGCILRQTFGPPGGKKNAVAIYNPNDTNTDTFQVGKIDLNKGFEPDNLSVRIMDSRPGVTTALKQLTPAEVYGKFVRMLHNLGVKLPLVRIPVVMKRDLMARLDDRRVAPHSVVARKIDSDSVDSILLADNNRGRAFLFFPVPRKGKKPSGFAVPLDNDQHTTLFCLADTLKNLGVGTYNDTVLNPQAVRRHFRWDPRPWVSSYSRAARETRRVFGKSLLAEQRANRASWQG
mgnify:CR=1 FL=1